MEIICYYDDKLKFCPIKENFLQYKDNLKLLVEIEKFIEVIAINNGILKAFFCKKLTGFDGFEIKVRKEKGIVIRIIYFLHQNKMILLNAFEKPDNYDTGKEKRKIDKQLEFAKQYIKKYQLNTKLYEKY